MEGGGGEHGGRWWGTWREVVGNINVKLEEAFVKLHNFTFCNVCYTLPWRGHFKHGMACTQGREARDKVHCVT